MFRIGLPTLSETYKQFAPGVYLNTVTRSYKTVAGLPISQSNRDKFKRFINTVYNEAGILLLAYSGYRDYAKQWELRKKYLAGGPRAGAPGYSWHNFGRAIDVIPINFDGSANWKTRDWAKIHAIAKRFGLKNGGTFADPGHISYQAGTTLENERQARPGWQQYATLEKQKGVTAKPKQVRDRPPFRLGNILLGVVIVSGLTYGGYRLYKRYGS